jgi:3-methyladenine DNA glycosylase AlkD
VEGRLSARERTPAKAPPNRAKRPLYDGVDEEVQAALSSLEQMSTQHDRENLSRFGITASKAFGVSMANLKVLAKRLGRNHELAAALWGTGWYEARMLTSFVDEPARVTPAQMDRWCRDFDNWAICDTVCFHLFDRTPHAWAKVAQWSGKRDEFVKRAAFALLACLALHDKRADDEPFARYLPLIERAAKDERNFVKKGVSWALRAVGRRNAALNGASVMVARRLAASPHAAARWVGKGALKELTSPAVMRGLAARRRGADR